MSYVVALTVGLGGGSGLFSGPQTAEGRAQLYLSALRGRWGKCFWQEMTTDQGYLQHPRSPDAEDNKEITVLEVAGSRVSGWGRGAWAGHNFCLSFICEGLGEKCINNKGLEQHPWNQGS